MHAEIPDVECVERRAIRGIIVLRADDWRGRIICWHSPAVDVGRKQPIANQRQHPGGVPIQEKANNAGVWISCQHLVTLERVNANAVLNSRSKFARGDYVHISPEPVLWVIWKVDACREGVPEVCPGRIAGLGDSDTVVKYRSARRELGQQPAILELVIQHDRIAGGIGAIWNGEARPERTSVYWSRQQVASPVISGKD